MSLASQFAIVAAAVIGIAMAVLGTWVAARIETGVIRHTALAAALYMDRFVEPHVQELARGTELSQGSRDALRDLMMKPSFGTKVVDIRIWRPDGTIAYSSHGEMIGKQFPITDKLEIALRGVVAAEFDELDSDENAVDKELHSHLLEIYAPVREAGTERIIAVAEIYQISDQLATELTWARVETLLVVCCLSLLMLGALSGIVRRGSRTITSQQTALSERVLELSRLLAQNTELRQRVADATRRASEGNERFLRRVSAELHDGPVQLIGLVLLRLDSIVPRQKGQEEPPPNKDLRNRPGRAEGCAHRNSRSVPRPCLAGAGKRLPRGCSRHRCHQPRAAFQHFGREPHRRDARRHSRVHQDLRLPLRSGGVEQRLPPCGRRRAAGGNALGRGPAYHRGER